MGDPFMISRTYASHVSAARGRGNATPSPKPALALPAAKPAVKARVGKARLTVRAKAGKHAPEHVVHEETAEIGEPSLEFDPRQHATVHVSLGVKRNAHYQSVSCDIGVTLPCTPATIDDALASARAHADAFLAETAEYLEKTLHTLGDQ